MIVMTFSASWQLLFHALLCPQDMEVSENSLSEIDAAWISEVERRYEEYKQGERPGIPANQVFAEADRVIIGQINQ